MSGNALKQEIFDKVPEKGKRGRPKGCGPTPEARAKAQETRRIKQELKDAELKARDPHLYEARLIMRKREQERAARKKAEAEGKIFLDIKLKTEDDKKKDKEVEHIVESKKAELKGEAPPPAPKEECPPPKEECPPPKEKIKVKWSLADSDLDGLFVPPKPKVNLQDTMIQKTVAPQRTVYDPFKGKGSLF